MIIIMMIMVMVTKIMISITVIIIKWDGWKLKHSFILKQIVCAPFKNIFQHHYFQPIDSLRLSDAYMHQQIKSSLAQLTACHWFGTKPLSDPMMVYCRTHGNKIQWNFNQDTIIFINENAFKNVVCKMAVILSQSQCRNRWEISLIEAKHCYDNSILYSAKLT